MVRGSCIVSATLHKAHQALGQAQLAFALAEESYFGGHSCTCVHFSFISKPMGLNAAILPVVHKDLPNSPRFTPYEFLSRCKFRTLTTCQPMVEFDLPTYSRFPLCS